MAPKELEKVLYFAASIVTWVDEEARAKDLGKLEKEVNKVARRLRGREGGARRRSCASRSSAALEYLQTGKQTGFTDEDHLWADSLEVNVKKLSDDDREKLEKDLRKAVRRRHRRHRGLHRGRRRAHAPGLGELPGHEAVKEVDRRRGALP